MSNPQRVSVTTLAQFLNLTPRQVQNLANDGVIHKDARGEYEMAASIQSYIRYLQRSRQGNSGSDELLKIKTRKEEAKTRMAEMEVRRLEGELIPASDVAKAWTDMVAHLRAKMLALPAKLAPQLLAAEDLNATQTLLKKQITEALQELAGTYVIIEAAPDRAPDDSEAGL